MPAPSRTSASPCSSGSVRLLHSLLERARSCGEPAKDPGMAELSPSPVPTRPSTVGLPQGAEPAPVCAPPGSWCPCVPVCQGGHCTTKGERRHMATPVGQSALPCTCQCSVGQGGTVLPHPTAGNCCTSALSLRAPQELQGRRAGRAGCVPQKAVLTSSLGL